MAKAGRIQHWKHGWIPVSPEAKAYVAGTGPKPVSGKMPAFAVRPAPRGTPMYGTRVFNRLPKPPADDLLGSIKEHGGFTYNPKTGHLLRVGKSEGFAVAVPGTEQVVGKETVGGDYVTREDFAQGVAKVITQYSDKIAQGAVLGGWYSPERNEFMVELTEIFDPDDREGAILAGKERNQEAIFDLKTGETIFTGGTGDHPLEQKTAPATDTPVQTDLMRPLSVEEIAAAKFYTGPGFKPLNTALRTASIMHPATEFYKQKLDSAINESVIGGSGATVYRGLYTWPGFPERFEPGDEYQDQGYFSTATDPTGKYPGDVKMIINVPPGANALDLYGQGFSHHMDEKELLLPRGTKLKVLSDMKVGDQRIVQAEVAL